MQRIESMTKIQSLTLIVLIVICTGEACTWTYSGSCYNLVNSKQSFWAAEAYCNTIYNGHLAAVTSQEEDDFLRARLIDLHLDTSIEK